MHVKKNSNANNLHDESIIVDSLAGATFNFDNLMKAGLTAAHITVAAHNEGFLKAIENIKDYYSALDSNNKLLLVKKQEDIIKAKRENKLGLILGFQTASPLEGDITNLSVFKKLGVRIVQLTYMGKNLLGAGCYEPNDGGLTYFGIQTIRELNRLGILVDISHAGWNTATNALEISKKPVILSHSNPVKLCDNLRNVPDIIIKKVAKTGGCIGINAHPGLCQLKNGVRPTIKDYLQIIDYTVDLVGINHVCLGLDLFDGFKKWQHYRWNRRFDELQSPWKNTKGLSKEIDIRKITHELSKSKRYTESDIQKILGENLMNVFKSVWK